MKSLLVIILLTFFAAGDVFSVPVDFKGSVGFDAIRINDYRRTESDTTNADLTSGTQAIKGSSDDAYIQSYIFRLNPQLVVNDHVTVKSEVASGHGRGGYLGDNTTVNQNNNTVGFGGRYYGLTSAQNDTLNVNQFYLDIYADMATFKVGRYNKHWGLGAVFNGGEKAQDRFFTIYEGMELTFTLGNFYLTPHYANLNSRSELTHGAEIKDLALSILYDNPDKDLKFGVYLGKRKSGDRNEVLVRPDDSNPATDEYVGYSNVRIIDVFYHKYWDYISLGLEIPLVDGDIGRIYDDTTFSGFQSSAYIAELGLEATESWEFKLYGGMVSGDTPGNTFEAFYLNPNYQIAELMFRYNLQAISNSNYNLYDSAISNTTYAKLSTLYKSGLWKWYFDFIWAKANETAKAGQTRAWNHELGYSFIPTEDQKDDMGYEVDLSFEYQWNPNLVLSGFLAYYSVGDYYKYTNNDAGAPDISTKNQMGGGMRLNLNF